MHMHTQKENEEEVEVEGLELERMPHNAVVLLDRNLG